MDKDDPRRSCPDCMTDNGKTCFKHCHESPKGLHEADPRSAAQADDTDFVVDYNCKHCGQTGAVSIDPKDIQWD